MKVVVTNSENASVKVDNKIVGQIDKGLLVLVGFTEGDNMDSIKYLVNKIVKLRIFIDSNGVMNKNVLDINGSILSVSQFTLYADTKKGNRPSYIKALNREESIKLYNLFNEELRKYVHVEEGIFGANMIVSNNNIGPTTIIMEV